jgi:hypothetical protein
MILGRHGHQGHVSSHDPAALDNLPAACMCTRSGACEWSQVIRPKALVAGKRAGLPTCSLGLQCVQGLR